MLSGLLRPGRTLESEWKDRQLWYCDHSDFDIFDASEYLKENRYIAVPLLLLGLNNENKLVPLAIMLRSHVPYDPVTNPIYTPKSSKQEWILAKMFFNNTDGMNHQVKKRKFQ